MEAFSPERHEEVESIAFPDTKIPDDYFCSPDHRWLYQARNGKFRLIDCRVFPVLISYLPLREGAHEAVRVV